MSTLRLEDLPIAYPRSGTFRRLRSAHGDRYEPRGFGRRTFLQTAAALGTTVGLGAIGFFAKVREAQATHDTWSGYAGCASFSYADDCHEPCTGFSPDVRGPEFCTACVEVDEPHGMWGWHYHGYRPYNVPATEATTELRDLVNNLCTGSVGALDAWNWDVGPCNVTDPQTQATITCNPMKIRCHDGHKRAVNPTGGWQNTICEGFRECTTPTGDVTGKSIMCS